MDQAAPINLRTWGFGWQVLGSGMLALPLQVTNQLCVFIEEPPLFIGLSVTFLPFFLHHLQFDTFPPKAMAPLCPIPSVYSLFSQPMCLLPPRFPFCADFVSFPSEFVFL